MGVNNNWRFGPWVSKLFGPKPNFSSVFQKCPQFISIFFSPFRVFRICPWPISFDFSFSFSFGLLSLPVRFFFLSSSVSSWLFLSFFCFQFSLFYLQQRSRGGRREAPVRADWVLHGGDDWAAVREQRWR
jgi:hypothetical protein